MKKYYILIFLIHACLFFSLNGALGTSIANKARNFFVPPMCPTIYKKRLNNALQELSSVQRKTYFWHLPSRSLALGSLGAAAGYLAARILHRSRPLLAATLTGAITTGITGFFLQRYIKTHPEVKKRATVHNLLSSLKQIDVTGNLVLKPETIKLQLDNFLIDDKISMHDKFTLTDQYRDLITILNNESEDKKSHDTGIKDLHVAEDVTTEGIRIKTINGHTGIITCLKVADGKIFTASTDHTAKIWDAQTGACLHELIGHAYALNCLVIDKGSLLTGSSDQTVKIWDINTGACLRTINCQSNHEYYGEVNFIAVVDKKLITGQGRFVGVWDLETGNLLRIFQDHRYKITCLNVTADKIITRSQDGTINVWDLKNINPECESCSDTRHDCHQHTIGSSLRSIPVGEVSDVVVAHGKIIIGSADNNTAKIFDLETGVCQKILEGHSDTPRIIVVDHKIITVSSKIIKFWDLETGDCINTFENNFGYGNEIALLKESIIIRCGGGQVTVFDPHTKSRRYFVMHTKHLSCLDVAPGKIITGSREGSITIWTDMEFMNLYKQALAFATMSHPRCGANSPADIFKKDLRTTGSYIVHSCFSGTTNIHLNTSDCFKPIQIKKIEVVQ